MSWTLFNEGNLRRISNLCLVRVRGVTEFRLHVGTEPRIFYVARFEEAVYVLHFFLRKTQAKRKADLDQSRKRDAALLESRKSK